MRFTSITASGLLVFLGGMTAAFAADSVQFNSDIRPILSDKCFFCHGPDPETREAGLRLDVESAAKADRDGFTPVVPGDPEKSELIYRIFADDEDDRMPPADSGKSLSDHEKTLLKQWIEQGADWQGHWAYETPQRPTPPEPVDASKVENAVDRFVQLRLAEAELTPAETADRRTLIRRVSLDLTGLPPAPDEVEAFVNDRSRSAYEKVVDRLLASPHYGERMAIPWLDVARYADTVGYHGDQNMNVFPYRDYVIESFNENKPFDQFVVEQIAGDLLPNPTDEQLIATGFNRLNMMTREGGAQPGEYIAKYGADRVRAVTTAFLGQTFACAECHDHKFDPITAKDFYSMKAFFADIKQWGVYADYGYTPNEDLRGFNNDYPFPPEILVTNEFLVARRDAKLKEQFALARKTADERGLVNDRWVERLTGFLSLNSDGWERPHVLATRSEKSAPLELTEAGDVLPPKDAVGGETIELTLLATPGTLQSIRLRVLPDERFDNRVARGGRNRFAATLSAVVTRADVGETPVEIFHAGAENRRERYSMGLPIIGVHGRWESDPDKADQPHEAIYRLKAPLELHDGDVLKVRVRSDDIGRFGISTSPLPGELLETPGHVDELAAGLGRGDWRRTAEQRDLIALAAASGEPEATGFHAQHVALQRAVLETRDGRAFTQIVETWEPKPVRVLARGNWQDESGELVEPALPGYLPGAEETGDRRLNRLDLARWIASPENPLTARVYVNRVWKQFFGTGLSGVLDDFGSQGEWPSHPALLDWLAVEFADSGWDMKHLTKLIVMSHTYRQASEATPGKLERDPANRLLSRQTPRRLPAELVRDNALAVSGLLNPALGGPPAHPYQPAGYYEHLNFPGREYPEDLNDQQYRRGVYSHWQRTFLHPAMANFDAPSREECVADRTVSNTPQQALTLLNDPSFVEAARVFAESLISESANSDFEELLNEAFARALARPPLPAETESLTAFYESQQAHYREHPEDADKLIRAGMQEQPAGIDPVRLAAWTSVCRVVLNLHETFTRY